MNEQIAHFDSWRELLSPVRWSLYRGVLHETLQQGIPFAMGGGLAAMAYAGQLRDTKDIDIYVQPQNRDSMIQIVLGQGLEDYYQRLPYDRKWIFRSWHDGSIIDVMWAMANQRAQVDAEWLNGPVVTLGDLRFPLVRPEETLWSKLYVLQHDRCDWPDALNMLHRIGPELDWPHLLERVGDDVSLLASLLGAFRWLNPEKCAQLPNWLWDKLSISAPVMTERADSAERATLLDSRPWFTPTLDDEHRLS